MKSKILKSLKKSLITSSLLIGLVFLLCLFSTEMREELLNEVLVMFVSFLAITFIAFIVSAYFKERSIAIGLIITAPLSYGTIHFLDIIVLDYLFFNGKEVNHTINNFAIVGILVAILTYFFDSYKNSKSYVKSQRIMYPLKKALLFSGIIVTIYSIISVLTFKGEVWGILEFMHRVLFTNWIVIFTLSIFLFNYIYKNYEKRKYLTYIYYIFVIAFFFTFCFFKYDRLDGGISIQNFLSYLIVRVPFVFMIILSVQISYMLEFSKKEKEYLKQETLESQLNFLQLKNQLSPHFLFNNINVLTSLIEEDPKKAVLFSENLSTIYRYFLDQEKEDIVTLKEELDFAERYLSLFKGRFESGLEYEVEKIEDIENYVVSTSLQQILENVIKHNSIDIDKPIKISVQKENDYLVITNNCHSKAVTEKSSKKGLDNIQKRYAFFTDKKVLINHSKDMFIVKLPLLKLQR